MRHDFLFLVKLNVVCDCVGNFMFVNDQNGINGVTKEKKFPLYMTRKRIIGSEFILCLIFRRIIANLFF